MELKFNERIYITNVHGIIDNTPREDENEIQREGVFMDEINIDGFEYKGNEKQAKEACLKHLVQKGAEKKYDYPSEINERLKIELELINSKGWTDCLLATYKIIQNAKKFAHAHISTTGPSSGLNSVVFYCLGLHHCDPIKYKLSYERFFYSDTLPIAISLCFNKKGFKRFNTMVFKRLPDFIEKGKKTTSQGPYKGSKIRHYQFDEDYSKPHISLWLSEGSKTFDLCKQVQKQYGEFINPNTISTDNQKTLELFQRGDIEGVYQNASEDKWEKKVLVEFHPDSFSDLVAINSFFRHVVDERRKFFINHKKSDNRRFSPLLKDLFVNPSDLVAAIPIHNAENSHLFECDDVLFETHGIIIYQEQMMKLVQLIVDFTPEESDNLRKALREKRDINKFQKEFLRRGEAKGHPLAGLKSLWKEWEENCLDYYPKGTAVARALNLFQIAYFKAHYPKAFDEINKKIW